MGKEYKQLREIKLQDVLNLEDSQLKQECLRRLTDCGFIEEDRPKWEKLTLKDLHKIRPGVTLKRIIESRYESIIHVTSDPYWSSWQALGYLNHILVCTVEKGSSGRPEKNNEYSINKLFDGDVYIQV